MKPLITSMQNATIKNLLLLREKARERKKQGLFLVEGIREVQMAIEAGYQITLLVYCSLITRSYGDQEVIEERDIPIEIPFKISEETTILEVTRNVFNRLALRQDSGGILACMASKTTKPGNLVLPANPLLLVLEAIEKPGNLGAILRTADAAGVDAVILSDPKTDLYNPNTIRASLGSLFTNQIVQMSTRACIDWLREHQISTFGAALTGTRSCYEATYSGATAIVMGSEAHGLSDQWLAAVDHLIKIPMQGKVDSLNVSTSAAILVFEAVRQRI